METLVQVAPGIGQHTYHHHHGMIDSDAHQHDEAAQSTSRPSTSSNTTSQSSERTTNTQPQDSSTTQYSGSTQNIPISQSQRPTSRSSRQSINNYNHGFDQSGFPLSSDSRFLQASPSSPRLQPTYRSTLSLGGSEATSPSRIKVRDLSHIQSFASEEYLARPRLGNRSGSFGPNTQYEISSMPVGDIIEMVAGLLTKITTTNDRQHEHLHRPVQVSSDQGTVSTPSNCVLAFHGKNVPSITILSYLSRIHKYCPTTYEVFLSLLVYFDRMTDNFNRNFMQQPQQASGTNAPQRTAAEDDDENDASSAMTIDDQEHAESNEDNPQYFVVDSFNIHRLVIAGVTCASKFFSDVFYTNSRYAKVGGLPLVELNNLELQFLLLNDFRLSIPVEELEAYGTMLVEFYAREIVAQEQAARGHQERTQPSSYQNSDDMYMRGSGQ